MLKYYNRPNNSTEEQEITYDEALRILLDTWCDTPLTRNMLTIQNYIECRNSFLRVDDPDTTLKPIPGLWNLTPVENGGKA